MPDEPDVSSRHHDGVAVRAALRRLARAPAPPWLHEEVARRMAAKLELILIQPEQVIDWWSSLGAGGALLETAYPRARQIRVEPDPVWAARSRAAGHRPWWRSALRAGGAAEVVLETQDIAPGAGLIWSNMMLHAADDPEALIARWHRLLRVDGFVMFSSLGPGTLRELREVYARQGWPAPTPNFVDMHDFGDMLVQAGFADPVMDQEVLTLTWPDPAALLRELRGLGGNTAPGRARGLRTPRWRARLENALEALRGPDGRIALGFEVAYGHAFKVAGRLRPGEPTTVSLDDMRAMVRSKHRSGSNS